MTNCHDKKKIAKTFERNFHFFRNSKLHRHRFTVAVTDTHKANTKLFNTQNTIREALTLDRMVTSLSEGIVHEIHPDQPL